MDKQNISGRHNLPVSFLPELMNLNKTLPSHRLDAPQNPLNLSKTRTEKEEPVIEVQCEKKVKKEDEPVIILDETNEEIFYQYKELFIYLNENKVSPQFAIKIINKELNHFGIFKDVKNDVAEFEEAFMKYSKNNKKMVHEIYNWASIQINQKYEGLIKELVRRILEQDKELESNELIEDTKETLNVADNNSFNSVHSLNTQSQDNSIPIENFYQDPGNNRYKRKNISPIGNDTFKKLNTNGSKKPEDQGNNITYALHEGPKNTDQVDSSQLCYAAQPRAAMFYGPTPQGELNANQGIQNQFINNAIPQTPNAVPMYPSRDVLPLNLQMEQPMNQPMAQPMVHHSSYITEQQHRMSPQDQLRHQMRPQMHQLPVYPRQKMSNTWPRTETQALPPQQQALPPQQQALPSQEHTLSSQQHALPSQQHALPSQQHALPLQQHALPSQQKALPSQQHAPPSQQQVLSPQEQALPPRQQALPPQQQALPPRQQALPPQQQTLPPQQHARHQRMMAQNFQPEERSPTMTYAEQPEYHHMRKVQRYGNYQRMREQMPPPRAERQNVTYPNSHWSSNYN